jgi:hypothetical protein
MTCICNRNSTTRLQKSGLLSQQKLRLIEKAFRSPIAESRCCSSRRGRASPSADRAQQRDRIAALAVGSASASDPLAARGEGGWPNCDRDHRVKYGNGPWRSLSGAQLHSYQRNQLTTTPDQKGHDQNDKEARGEQLATGMRGRRKVKTIIRFARVTNRRLRSSFSTHSARPRVGHAFSRQIVATETPHHCISQRVLRYCSR